MCVVIAKPKDRPLPSMDVLDNCEWSNRDGIGVAWTDGAGQVTIKKDFNDLAALKTWLPDNVKQSDALLVHFRMATSGGTNIGMRHPFPLTQDEDILRAPTTLTDVALAHNGVLWQGNKKFSDTALLVKDILGSPDIKPAIRSSKAIQMLINGMLGSHNKLALLYGDGFILTFGDFIKDHGTLYSNEQFKRETSAAQFGYDKDYTYKYRKDMEICAVCYKEYHVKALEPYTAMGAFKTDVICTWCVQKGRNGPRVKASRRANITDVCEGCNVTFPVDDLTYLNLGNESSASMWRVCDKCAYQFSGDVVPKAEELL